MKRTPLRRRTPLKRTPLKASGPGLPTRARLKPVSAKRRKRDAVYPSSRRAVYERAEGMCEARFAGDCAGDGHQVHHLAGRGGPDPHRLDNLLLVCRACHELIHGWPEEAYRLGLMVKRHGGGA